MMALVRKELRELLWPAVIAAGCFAAIAALASWRDNRDWLVASWIAALPVAALILGANAVAKERTHRTLEWHALWPVSRAQWWSGKLLAHLVLLALGVVAVAVATSALWPWRRGEPGGGHPVASFVVSEAGLALFLFALAFLMSSLRKSTFEAFGLSLLIGLLAGLGWAVAAGDLLPGWFGPRLGISTAIDRPWTVAAGGVALAFACLTAAAWATISTPVLAFRRRSLRGSLAATALCIVAIPCLVLGGLYLAPAERPVFGTINDVALSPDGRRVAFVDHNGTSYEGQTPRLWAMRIDGTDLHCIARGPVWTFQWLPDSRRLVCEWGTRSTNPFHLLSVKADWWWWMLDFDHGPARRLAQVASRGGWPASKSALPSPGGTYLLAGDQLVDLRTQRLVAILPPVLLSQETTRFLAWAPDESAIYIERGLFQWSVRGPKVTPPKPVIDRVDIPSGKLVPSVYVPPAGADLRVPPGQCRWVVLEWKNPPSTTLVDIVDGATIGVPGAGAFIFCITPGGRYAWLHDETSLFVVDLRARKVVRRLGGPGVYAKVLPYYGPVYSADGKYVLFRAVPVGRRLSLNYVAPGDGSSAPEPIDIPRGEKVTYLPLAWAADDQLLLYATNPELPGPDDVGLATLSLSGQLTTILTAPNAGREARP